VSLVYNISFSFCLSLSKV